MRTGERRCPACAGVETLPRGAKNGVPLAECRACATLYAASSPAAAGFDYDGYYDEANLSVPDFVGARLDEIFASFAPYRRTNRLLDIGCGAGSLLEAARRAGWEAHGTEVSRPAVEHARRAGFEVFCGDLSAAPFPEGHFDVVTASEILEHLPDPRVLLAEVARVLRPGGHAVVSIPNTLNIEERFKWLLYGYTSHFKPLSREYLAALGEEYAGAEEIALHINPLAYPQLRYILEKNGLRVLGLHRDKPKKNAWAFLPFVALIRLLNRLQPEKKRRARWSDELQSDEVLLGGNTLVVHASKG